MLRGPVGCGLGGAGGAGVVGPGCGVGDTGVPPPSCPHPQNEFRQSSTHIRTTVVSSARVAITSLITPGSDAWLSRPDYRCSVVRTVNETVRPTCGVLKLTK